MFGLLVTNVQVPVMDKAGRRLLLLVPMVAMVLILALITIALKLQVSQPLYKRQVLFV